MPTTATLERFIARVESNAHAEAIEEFYTENASMQENNAAPRIGRDALVAHFRRGSSYAYGGTTVKVLRTPWVAPAQTDGAWFVTPLSVEYRAEFYPSS